MFQVMRMVVDQNGGGDGTGETLPETYRTVDEATEGAKEDFRSLHGTEGKFEEHEVLFAYGRGIWKISGGHHEEVYQLIEK